MVENSTPKQTRHGFQKGQSGNPAGRPAGVRHKAVEALDVLGREAGRDIVESVIRAAKTGDARSAELVLRRIWPERKGRPVCMELPAVTDSAGIIQALARITEAAASGEITTEEGAALAGLVEAQRRAIETGDLEARIAALEARNEAH